MQTTISFSNKNKSVSAIQTVPKDPTRALIELLCVNRLPFSFSDSTAFQHLVEAIKNQPDWKPPHRTTLSGPVLENLYFDVIQVLKSEFCECDHISLTIDGTTGSNGVPYWSVTASGIDKQFRLHSQILACVPVYENHNGHNLAKVVIQVLNEIGLSSSKVVAIVTDEGGGAPCVADHFPQAEAIFCSAHILQTVLRTSFDVLVGKYSVLGDVLTLSRKISSQYNQSNIARQQIQVLQARLSSSVAALKQDVVTRWLSQLNCLRSILENEQALRVWLKTLPPSEFLSIYKENSFWPILKILVDMLLPFEHATKEFSKEKEPTLQLTIQVVLDLLAFLEEMNSEIRKMNINSHTMNMFTELVGTLSSNLTAKFTNWSDSELVAYALNPSNRVATFDSQQKILDSAYEKISSYLSEQSEAADVTITSQEAIPIQASSSTLSPFMAIYAGIATKRKSQVLVKADGNTELDDYKRCVMHSAEETVSEFWSRMANNLPKLFQLSRKIFSIPCSQTASEREFSLLRLTCTHLRGRLDPQTVNKIIVCAAYVKKRDAASTSSTMRSQRNIDADKHRIRSLLNTRKKKVLANARREVSASLLADLDLSSILDQMLLPPDMEVEDFCDTEQNSADEFLECDDGELSDDDDYQPPAAKVTRTSESDHVHSSRHSTGKCELFTVNGSTTLMKGCWTSSNNYEPTPKEIFREHLPYVDIFAEDLMDSMEMTDKSITLKSQFRFKLNEKGQKQYQGRRPFLRAVSEVIWFGDNK